MDDPEKDRNQLSKIKSTRLSEQPDSNRIQSIQNYSKYKELPPIKPSDEIMDQTQRSINNKSNASIPSNMPSFNLNTNPKSINKLYNPDITDQNQRRFQWDYELKRRSNEQRVLNSTRQDMISEKEQLNTNTNRTPKDKSHLYGTELLNDLRLPKINSPNLKSTPDSGRFLSNRDSSHANQTKHNLSSINPTPIEQQQLTQRKILKREKKRMDKTKQPYTGISDENKQNKFEPQLDGFQLQGATLRVDPEAKVRPLANMNYKNAEEKVKIRTTSRLYSSMMMTTPRSFISNDMFHYQL